ncbi:hypothetical protein ACWKSP_05665 [Micromonosporaceae bacterium Da 78-11]
MDLENLIGRASDRVPVIRQIARRGARALPVAWQAARSMKPVRTPRNAGEVRYAAVLDGRTMNLDIALPAGEAPPVTVTVVLTGRQRLTGPGRIRSTVDGVVQVSATVLLGEDGLPVHTERRWTISCVVTDAAGRRRNHPLLGAPEPRRVTSGPTIVAPLCPRTGRRYQVETDPAGRTILTVQQAKRLAEVAEVHAGWTVASLQIRTVGFRYEQAPDLRFTLRDDGAVRAVPTSLDGDRLAVALPASLLAETVTAKECLWDLHLVNGRREIAVTSTLHDLTDPKAVLRLPTSIISISDGVAVRIRPYFTPRGRLVLACLRLASAPGVAGRTAPRRVPAPRAAADDQIAVPR